MILKLTKNHLSALDNKVTSSDSLIKIETDVDAVLIGVLRFFDGTTKILEFVKEKDETFKQIARLVIDTEDVKRLDSVTFCIESIDGSFRRTSNQIGVAFDTKLIGTDIKRHINNEYAELLKRIKQVEESIEFGASKLLTNINITNKDLIKPGMIPVAIDSKGNFVAQYPFSNHVVSVNGITAANGAVIIDSSMIRYKKNGKSIEQTFDDHADAIASLKTLLTKVISNQKEIRQKLDELDIKLETHINSGII